jgi:predicted PurR-regulated permease PerM
VLRVVLIVVAVVLTLFLMFLLRQPLTWIFIAAFLAIALSGPIAFLSRYMRRGFAVAIVYLLLLLTPFALIGLLIPPIVTQANNLVQNLPEYAEEVTQFVNDNDRLRQLQDDYDITGKLEEQAEKLPARLGDAAGVLGDIGVGLVNSIFAAVTIIVLSLFILSSGRKFLDAWIREYQPAREEWWHNLFGRIANAIGNYVAGALLQATIAGFTSWIMLMILGVDFALPLAVLIFLLDLIPLVGATLGAIAATGAGFLHSPTAGIVVLVFFVVYQQVENHLLQPVIMARAVRLNPLTVLVSVLLSVELAGLVGALLAIPAAGIVQVLLREFAPAGRQALPQPADGEPAEPAGPPDTGPAASAIAPHRPEAGPGAPQRPPAGG